MSQVTFDRADGRWLVRPTVAQHPSRRSGCRESRYRDRGQPDRNRSGARRLRHLSFSSWWPRTNRSGRSAKSWRCAGQYSRPKKMICRWRRFQVSFGNTFLRSRSACSTVVPSRQPPAPREPVDVGVDRERGHVERLRHHHAGRLVPDTGERLEERPVRRSSRRPHRRSGWPRSRGSSPWSAPGRPRG